MDFSREQVNVLGIIDQRTTFDIKPNIKTIDVRYLVIDSQSPYHIGRPSLNILGAIMLTPHLALKFSISTMEVGVVHTD